MNLYDDILMVISTFALALFWSYERAARKRAEKECDELHADLLSAAKRIDELQRSTVETARRYSVN